MEVDVVPPNVNTSNSDFKVAKGKIYFGLSAIKSCGSGAAEGIANERNRGGDYSSLFGFCERSDSKKCNRAAIEALIKAGAFDTLGGHRAQFMAVLDRAMQSGVSAAKDRRSGQKGLFEAFDDEEEEQSATLDLPNVPPFEEKEILKMEREVLGFYQSSHPLAEFETTIRTYCTHSSQSMAKLKHRDEVVLGGMLSAIKMSHTKNSRAGTVHTKYAMWDLEDFDGIMRCILWPEQFAEVGHLVQSEAILGVVGKVDRRPGAEEVNLIVDKLLPMEEMSKQFSSGMVIRVQEDKHGERALQQLREIVRGYPGKKRLRLRLDLASGAQVWVESANQGVEPNSELNDRIDQLLGEGNRLIERAAPKPSEPSRRDYGRAKAAQ